MKTILTGMNGTVAPVLGQWLADRGHAVIRWDRSVVPTDNEQAIRDFMLSHQPDAFFHIATGSPDWAESVARICAEEEIRLLFTSSVSVFSGSRPGPITPDMEPDATDDYGRYKIECECRVRAAHPEAIIVRLGWQIGSKPGSNNMVDYLHRAATEQGRIEASTRWFPACSFLQDTAESLEWILANQRAGTYHLDGNPGLHFHDIASGVNRLLEASWTIIPSTEPVFDNRMHDPRIPVRPITERLAVT